MRTIAELPIGIDTETTGVDIWHGCRPFFVSTYCHMRAYNQEPQLYWEWDVDPLTRTVLPPKEDLAAIESLLSDQPIVLHNPKFDVRALQFTGIQNLDWDLIEDTLVASHCVDSLMSHKLKDLCLHYLDINNDDERELQKAVNDCRRQARKLKWRIANEGDPHFPGVKKGKKGEGWWKYDMWLPRAIAQHDNLHKSHPYWTICKRYAMLDAERTAHLWIHLHEGLKELELLDQYEIRRKNLETTHTMEQRGVSVSLTALADAKAKYGLAAEKYEGRCCNIAGGTIENLGSPKQLQKVLYEQLNLEPVKETKTGYSTDKETLEYLREKAYPNSKQYHFLNCLLKARQNTTGVNYLDSYQRFGCPPISPDNPKQSKLVQHIIDDYIALHPGINTTATRTTRSASSDPNEQNISKKEDFNLREVFCPYPGREWYSSDYSNIEMRLFAYASGDKQMIEAFETGYKVHLIMCEILWPNEWKRCQKLGLDFSKEYEATLYQWTKNGNFSLIYGAQKHRADTTYHQAGAYETIRHRMPQIDSFMEKMTNLARSQGYVTTMGGYRLYVPRNKPYAAVNYFIQGSAGWYLILANNRIHDYLKSKPDHYQIMCVHDELDFDFPIQRNYTVLSRIADIMELSGKELGVHVPVSVEQHRKSWAVGVKLDSLSKDWRTNPLQSIPSLQGVL